MSGERTMFVRCLDGEVLEVEEAVALQSPTVKQWKDNCSDVGNFTPPLNVTSIILAKVIKYCKRHLEAATNKADGDAEVPVICTAEELKRFDADFMKVDDTTLFELLVVYIYIHYPLAFDYFAPTVFCSVFLLHMHMHAVGFITYNLMFLNINLPKVCCFFLYI